MTFSIKALLFTGIILFAAVIGYKLYSNINQDIQEARTFFEPLKQK